MVVLNKTGRKSLVISINETFFGILGIFFISVGVTLANTSGDTKSDFFLAVVVCVRVSFTFFVGVTR